MYELTEQDKLSPLYKYYSRDIKPCPQEVVDQIMSMDFDKDGALPIQECNRLFEDGYLPGERGIYLLPGGGVEVANLTPMPGVTAEMIDFWFAWHGLASFRYAVWDKDDHFYCQTQNVDQALNDKLSLRERFWHTTHIVEEQMIPGQPTRKFPINFVPPWEVGFDKEKFEAFNGTIISSRGTMVHFFRPTENGGELRTRFWTGWTFDGKDWSYDTSRPVNLDGSRALLMHNVKEYTHLAEILPEIYEEFKDNFIVGLE